jgi:N-acetylglucosaminyldiphosphoundecaprenol N-acetyl-beta-D-mannosaminyltransferase
MPANSPCAEIQRTNILGVGVSAVNMRLAIEQLERWIARSAKSYVCVTGVHGLMECQRDPALRRLHNEAGMVAPDGMPLVYISRMMRQAQVDRVYGPDLMLAMCELSQDKGYRHFFYGTTAETLDRLTARLLGRFPKLPIAGSYAPPFRELTESESAGIAALINSSKADIVWVGLSTPRQEKWMARHRPLLDAPALLGVGAAFDFHAGRTPQAPRWMQRACLEWAFRLAAEPRRLWKRYLRNNPLFATYLTLQLLGLKRFEIQ